MPLYSYGPLWLRPFIVKALCTFTITPLLDLWPIVRTRGATSTRVRSQDASASTRAVIETLCSEWEEPSVHLPSS